MDTFLHDIRVAFRAYAVTQRTKEIGVRMALGAGAGEVIRLVMGQGLRPAAVGVLLGVGGALLVAKVMTRLLYEVAPRDPVTLSLTVVLLLAVVALACVIPAWRATKIPPAAALRAD